MKTGTPGLASGIHSGILPGRQKTRPHIRAPAFRSDLFLAGIILSRAKAGQAPAGSESETDPEEKENRKGIYGGSAGKEAIRKNGILKTGTPSSLPP